MEKQICELYPSVKECYVITDKDEIINKNTGNHLKHLKGKDGYIMISLMKKEGGTTYIPLHRLKMMAFNPVPNMENLQVNHIDGNKNNIDFNNLEWCSAKENVRHAWENGLSSAKNISGENSRFCHYSKEQALKVVELLKTNLYTDKEIAEITGTNAKSFVSRIRRKETWKELTQDLQQPLGKPQRPNTFNKKSSTTISKESRV